MKIDVLTIFPQMFNAILGTSIIKRAQDLGSVSFNIVDVRDFTLDKHRSVDDRPYGGGAGMVMKPEPLYNAIASLQRHDPHVILLSPQGQTFNQQKAIELSVRENIVLICGHYEGVDERVRIGLADEELSIGDYILTNGNLPAMIVIDAVVRLIPGVLGCDLSTVEESFANGLLEYPQYTRPEEFAGMRVPEVLLSGNHEKIKQWRQGQAIARTRESRPDLMLQ
jgi:tRNA (guanine37-N1)-methyltransferase